MARDYVTLTTYRCHVHRSAAESAAFHAAVHQGTNGKLPDTKVAEERPRLEPVDRGRASAPGEDCVIGGLFTLDPLRRQED